MGFRPIQDKVLVLRDVPLQRSEGGIVIPPSAQEKSIEGTVLAVGPGKWVGKDFIPVTLSAGDRVIFSTVSGTDVQIEDQDCVVLNDGDILGVSRSYQNEGSPG